MRRPRLPAWKVRTRQPQQSDREPVRLGVALLIAFSLATPISLLLVPVALAWFDPKTVGDRVNVVKSALTVIAGIGGVVALVVAYRRQQVAEEAQRLAKTGEKREQNRLYAERFAKASEMLGNESPAVRLAGVHALANLADDWEEGRGRQTCIDVLCAYLRVPPGKKPDAVGDLTEKHTEWLGMHEVRTTIIRLIADRLHQYASPSWRGASFDFTGTVFDMDIDFSGAEFTSGAVTFDGAQFSGDAVNFEGLKFSGAIVGFVRTEFSGGTIDFSNSDFSAGKIYFSGANFSGATVHLSGAAFNGSTVYFNGAKFSDGTVDFNGASFAAGTVDFSFTKFSGGIVQFCNVEFVDGEVAFNWAEFSGGMVHFRDTEFAGATADFKGGKVDFFETVFSGGTVNFDRARLSGARVGFMNAEYSSGTVDFSKVADWSYPPLHLPLPPHDVVIYPRRDDHDSPRADEEAVAETEST